MNTKALLLFLCLCFFRSSAYPQGSLTPPAAPTPTMKALDQIEPRIPIDATHTPGDANNDFIINQRGSYYLTGNVTLFKTTGIQVAALDVTIDLSGFTLNRTIQIGNSIGINVTPFVATVTIRNGAIEFFNKAIGGAATSMVCDKLKVVGIGTGGRLLELGSEAVVTNCQILDGGILTGARSVVRDTIISSSAAVSVDMGDDSQAVGLTFRTGGGEVLVGARGLIADCQINATAPPPLIINGSIVNTGDGAVVRHCTISAGNTSGSAMQVGAGSLVTGCRILQAFRDGIVSAGAPNVTVESCSVQSNGRTGIGLGPQARVRDCTVEGSGGLAISVGGNSIVSNSTAAGGQAVGISTGSDSTIKDCTAQGNAGDGIQAVDRCQIIGCNSNGNGSGVTGSGITAGLRTTVKNCTAAENQKSGIVVLGASVVLENNAAHNGLGGAAAGIDSSGGSGSRIEANMVRNNNGTGILGASNDVIIRNYSFSNTTNYNPASGTNFGPIELPSTSTHPTANF